MDERYKKQRALPYIQKEIFCLAKDFLTKIEKALIIKEKMDTFDVIKYKSFYTAKPK